MSWSGSQRRSELPPDWRKRRARRFKADDYRCTWRLVNGTRCEQAAEECDHIGSKHDHSHENLRSLCKGHHALHTGQQSADSRMANKRKAAQKFRRTETHPGAL